MRTTFMAKAEGTTNDWFVLDATDRVLGRMAARVATVLMGKHKPTYTAHVDTGDHVVILNAAKVRIQPDNRPRNRMIRHHTGFLGNMKETSLQHQFAEHPDRVIMLAVRRMMPKTKLGRQMLTKLRIYPGAEHPHVAQKPAPFPEWT